MKKNIYSDLCTRDSLISNEVASAAGLRGCHGNENSPQISLASVLSKNIWLLGTLLKCRLSMIFVKYSIFSLKYILQLKG